MTEKIKEQIMQLLEHKQGQTLTIQELASTLHAQKSSDLKALIQTVAQMEREKLVEFTKNNGIRLPASPLLLEGNYRKSERGFGFVFLGEGEDDVYIPAQFNNFAMDGDRVQISIIRPADRFHGNSAEGKIDKIIQRGVTQLVGEFFAYAAEEVAATDLYGYVLPNEKKLANLPIYIIAEGIKPEAGSICMVEITAYPERAYPNAMEGLVSQVLGHKNDPGMDILSIVTQYGIPIEFSQDVLNEAEQLEETISDQDRIGRRDLSNQQIVTIDGEDAKDLDDAVTVKRLADGNFFLGVHIADVSHYIVEDSPLDREAFERGTSVYLTDRVIPMLPRRLSNGICSLNPNVPRLTMSCEMEINPDGKVVRYEIFPSIIQTTARMTYTAVNQILEEQNEETRQKYVELVPMFEAMKELHTILERMRKRRGALAFEDREAKILVTADGAPEDIQVRQRGVGERLIESFMLVANETVAEHFHALKLPFLYRIHQQPKAEKMQRFLEFATNFGIMVKGTKETVTPKTLQNVLAEVVGKPEEAVVNTVLLRSMQQARYSEESEGHYGLAAEYYTHFTSPIRRYPDLIVHRLIRSYQSNSGDEKLREAWEAKLPDIADHSSKMERRAVEAERETDAMKKAEYMVQKIGEKYQGVISSVTKFGLFIELPNTIEGLVHVNSMDWDYFIYDERQLELRGERTQDTYRVGQPVEIKVVQANPLTREIDFELLIDRTKLVNSKKVSIKQNAPKKRAIKKQSHTQSKHTKNKNTRNKTQPFYKKALKKKKKKK